MIVYRRLINMVPGGQVAVVNMSQYDSDVTLEFELYASEGTFVVQDGTTVLIRGTKPDGNGISLDGTLESTQDPETGQYVHLVTVEVTQQMTAVAGKALYELSLRKDNVELNTANFVIDIERAPLDADTVPSESVIREIDKAVEKYLDEHEIVIDDTLSQQGKAADAEKTGDEITSIKQDLDQTPFYKGYPSKTDYPTLAHISQPGSYYILGSRGYTDTPLGENGQEGILFVFRSSYGYATQLFIYNSGDEGSMYFRVVSISDATLTDAWKPVGTNSTFSSGVTSWLIGKKVSIIGDSIDTFDEDGYKIDSYSMFYPAGDVQDVNQTWWMKVINTAQAELEVNASYSGSRVTNTSPSGYPDFYDRVSLLGSPDTIFITLGTNDANAGVSLGEYDFDTTYTSLSESEFIPAYIKGIKALQTLYPNATIICISEKMADAYKESIIHIANELSVTFIDASGYDYGSGIGIHPAEHGMNQIAKAILYPTDATLTQELPANGKAVGDALSSLTLSDKEKTAILGLLHQSTYMTDEAEQFYLDLVEEWTNEEITVPTVYNLTNADFTRKMRFTYGNATAYPYLSSGGGFVTYGKFDIAVETGKTYKVTATVPSQYASTAGMILIPYDQTLLDAYNNQESANTSEHTNASAGWGSLEKTFTVPYSGAGEPCVGMLLSFRQVSSGSTISNDFEITSVHIEEVVEESRHKYPYILKNNDFKKGVAITYSTNAVYPYTNANPRRMSYTAYDLLVENGKTYRVKATVNSKYAGTAQMAVEAFDQYTLDAYASKSNLNTQVHTNSSGYGSLTQDVYIGKTRDGATNCVGFRISFGQDSVPSVIADDFVVERVTVEEIPNEKDLYTCLGGKYAELRNVNAPKKVIFDTDWMEDVDDAVAVRVLSWGVQTGKIDLIGAVLDAVDNTSVSSLSRYLDYEGLGDAEIGADKQAERTNSNPEKDYHAVINSNWSYGKYSALADVEDSTAFYRRLLTGAEGKVDIISVGFLNALSRLLDSTSADGYTTMTGVELVKAKVGTIWVMGGKYPTASSREFNFGLDELAKQASHNFCEKCPVPVVFLGFEAGNNVYSGQTLADTTGTDDLLYKILDVYGVAGTGRLSWDPMTALLAIRGSAVRAGYSEVRGTNVVDASTGINTFTVSENGKDTYVVKRHTNAWYEYELNQILEKHGW